MAPEILALIDKPWLLLAVLAVGAALGMFTERVAERASRAKRRAYWAQKARRTALSRNSATAGSSASGFSSTLRVVPDASDQLRTVMQAQFRVQPLFNRKEKQVLEALEKILLEERPGWRAMGQVSLGEILASDDKEAYLAVNSKRVDLLIVDADCRPIQAVEYQGAGHYQGMAAARDAVKREALRRAGIGYTEVMRGDTPAELRARIRKLSGSIGA